MYMADAVQTSELVLSYGAGPAVCMQRVCAPTHLDHPVSVIRELQQTMQVHQSHLQDTTCKAPVDASLRVHVSCSTVSTVVLVSSSAHCGTYGAASQCYRGFCYTLR
jgi:hypothetical protein